MILELVLLSFVVVAALLLCTKCLDNFNSLLSSILHKLSDGLVNPGNYSLSKYIFSRQQV